jgi:hypothetical protein
MSRNGRKYTADELAVHFADSVISSTSSTKSFPPKTTGAATFHIWKSDTKCSPEVNLIDVDIATMEAVKPDMVSRITIFDRAAQPLYPPSIYTRSDHGTLTSNIGKIIPIFRRVPRQRDLFAWDGYVKIISVDIVRCQIG